jgi:hypothetical protein
MPKRKDLDAKSRVLNSYAKGPARKALRLVSTALTWIFRQLPKTFTGFTLHSMTDAKELFVQGNTRILKGAGRGWQMLVEQNDVVRMFTKLGKKEIAARVQEALDEAERRCTGRGGRSRCVTIIRDGNTVLEVRWGEDRSSEDNVVLPFELIMLAVEFDLAHNFCKIGDWLMEQVGGCPIGGLLSALYANIYCAHDERLFMEKWKHIIHLFYAIRQMDDLIMVMRWDGVNTGQLRELVAMRDDVRKGLYTGGPTTETEDKVQWMGKPTRVWAGLQLRIGEEGVVSKTNNKNEESIRREGMQRYPRYTPGQSWQTDELRVGLMLGNARRLRGQCMTDSDFLECLELDYRECLLVGTAWDVVAEVVRKLPLMIEGTEEE